jgi:putative nucleotidyltransferase with HDIG domain
VTTEEILAKIDNLPTLPFVAMKIGELVEDPNMSHRQIADVLRQDVSLSAKVLRLANSSYYAVSGGVTDIGKAVSVMGLNSLHQLVLSVSVMGTLRTPAGALFDAKGLWLHALGVATCAEVVARRIRHPDPGLCFTGGLLHDMGKVALANADPKRFVAAFQTAKSKGEHMHVAEKGNGLPSHDKVGIRLARRWRFPPGLSAPIEFHHHDPAKPEDKAAIPTWALPLVDIVSVSDEICRQYKIGDGGSPEPEQPNAATLARLGLGPLHVLEIYSSLMRRLEVSKIFLELV